MSAWEPRKGGWISGTRRLRVKTQETITSVQYGVHYTPAQCPQCFGLDLECYSTRDELRYYKCRECGESFKAIAKYQFPKK